MVNNDPRLESSPAATGSHLACFQRLVNPSLPLSRAQRPGSGDDADR